MRQPLLIALACLPVLAACDRAESTLGPPPAVSLAPAGVGTQSAQFAPYKLDPGKTGRVAAQWLRYAGEPDDGGVPQHAVLLQFKDGTKSGAEAGIVISGVKDVRAPAWLGLDFQKDGTCDANGPQLVMTMSDGQVLSFDCALGELGPSPLKGAAGWTRVTWALPPSWPAGVTIRDLRIVLRWRGTPVRTTIGSLSGITVNPGWPGIRIYVADSDSNRIARIDNILGNVAFPNITYFGVNGMGVGQFRRPMDVFVDGQSRIHVADMLNDRVVRINDMTGAGWQAASSTITCPPYSPGLIPGYFAGASICQPVGIFVDTAGLVYAHDALGRIYRFSMTGGALTPLINFINKPASNDEQDVFLDKAGYIYGTSFIAQVVIRWNDMSGAGDTRHGLNYPVVTRVSYAVHLFVDGAGTIFATDQCRLYRMSDIAGTNKVAFPALPVCFGDGPTSVGTDLYGRIYFTATNAGLSHVYRMNDITGAGLVEIGTFGGRKLHGVWVEDIAPPV